MPAKQMPVLVKHCALAIYKTDYCTGTKVERVQQSLDIAVSRLIQYGFLWKNSGKVTPERIKLKAKGKTAENRHRREKGGKAKTDEWNGLYKLIQEEAEEDEGSGATSEDAVPEVEEARESRPMQRRRRLAKTARASARRKPKRTKRAKRARRR